VRGSFTKWRNKTRIFCHQAISQSLCYTDR